MKFRIGMILLLAGASSLYVPLNRMLTDGYILSIPQDTWIPLWPVWVIPYLLCLPIWGGCLIWAAWKMNDQLFRSFITAGLFVLLSAAVFFAFSPLMCSAQPSPATVGRRCCSKWCIKMMEPITPFQAGMFTTHR